MKIPESLEKHQADYSPHAWEEYSFEELGKWIHLLAKRAGHRIDSAKKRKDLHEAQNYLDMMQARLNALM